MLAAWPKVCLKIIQHGQKLALKILKHGKKLACSIAKSLLEDLKTWPKGKTLDTKQTPEQQEHPIQSINQTINQSINQSNQIKSSQIKSNQNQIK